MRSLLLWGLPVCVFAQAPPLTYEQIVAKARPDLIQLQTEAELASRDRQLSATGGVFLSGPSVSVETGPRRSPGGGTTTDLAVTADAPLLLRPGLRRESRQSLGLERALAEGALRLEARLRLRHAYLDGWLAQEVVRNREEQLVSARTFLTIIEARVRNGADPAYLADLGQGDVMRAQTGLDEARKEQADGWAALRGLSAVPDSAVELADPGLPQLSADQGVEQKCRDSLLRKAATQRGVSRAAEFRLQQAAAGARWGVRGSHAREGDERVTRVGLVYHLPRLGETSALKRETGAGQTALEREQDAALVGLDARCTAAAARQRQMSAPTPPADFAPALRAMEARLKEGKDRPSEAMLLRRQLLEAREAALRRWHQAHVLAAEIDTLTAGDAP